MAVYVVQRGRSRAGVKRCDWLVRLVLAELCAQREEELEALAATGFFIRTPEKTLRAMRGCEREAVR